MIFTQCFVNISSSLYQYFSTGHTKRPKYNQFEFCGFSSSSCQEPREKTPQLCCPVTPYHLFSAFCPSFNMAMVSSFCFLQWSFKATLFSDFLRDHPTTCNPNHLSSFWKQKLVDLNCLTFPPLNHYILCITHKQLPYSRSLQNATEFLLVKTNSWHVIDIFSSIYLISQK